MAMDKKDTVEKESFEVFLSQLKLTNKTLDQLTDFATVKSKIAEIEIYLNELNFLLGKADLKEAVTVLFKKSPAAFSVLKLLVAIPDDDMYVKNSKGEDVTVSSFSKSPESIMEFMDKTGISKLFTSHKVTNLVDYVFGVEVGLDSNRRKNRFGKVMELTIANVFTENNIQFREQVRSSEFPELLALFGKDIKRFDFCIATPKMTYLIETNFYSGGGSKPSEVARAYQEVETILLKSDKFTFVWITDGIGWKTAKTVFGEAYKDIRYVYNLTTITKFIQLVKSEIRA